MPRQTLVELQTELDKMTVKFRDECDSNRHNQDLIDRLKKELTATQDAHRSMEKVVDKIEAVCNARLDMLRHPFDVPHPLRRGTDAMMKDQYSPPDTEEYRLVQHIRAVCSERYDCEQIDHGMFFTRNIK